MQFVSLHQYYYKENNSITLTEDNAYNSKLENANSNDALSFLNLEELHEPASNKVVEETYNLKKSLLVVENICTNTNL